MVTTVLAVVVRVVVVAVIVGIIMAKGAARPFTAEEVLALRCEIPFPEWGP